MMASSTVTSATVTSATETSSSPSTVPPGNSFECRICGQDFYSLRTYKTHKRLHRESVYYRKCALCGRFYESKEELQRHKTLVHGKSWHRKGYGCDRCEKVFADSNSLENHKADVHPMTKPLKWKHRRQAFSQHTKWRAHIATHNEKYECEVCGKKFSKQTSLQDHMDAQHMCNKCEKSFANKQILQAHKKTHKKTYECDKCGRTFTKRKVLKKHREQHIVARCKQTSDHTDSVDKHQNFWTLWRPAFAFHMCQV